MQGEIESNCKSHCEYPVPFHFKLENLPLPQSNASPNPLMGKPSLIEAGLQCGAWS
jgi:hypothetical protein